MVIIAGPGVASAIRNQFNTVTDAIGSGTAGENFYDAVDLPDPENGTAFAVYSEDDHSLMFYKRRGVPQVGDMFNYRRVTEVYTGFEDNYYWFGSDYSVVTTPWFDRHTDIKAIKVVDTGIRPKCMSVFFADLVSLESADIRNLNVGASRNFNDTFFRCTKLKTIDLSGWDLTSATSLACTFQGCSLLERVSFAGCSTTKLDTMFGLFFDCSNLIEVDFGDMFSTAGCTDFSRLFGRCVALKQVDLSMFDVKSAQHMWGMFYACPKLERIDGIASWDFSSVSYFSDPTANITDGMFESCSSLQLDCSEWNVNATAKHDNFNAYASGVTLPKAWR